MAHTSHYGHSYNLTFAEINMIDRLASLNTWESFFLLACNRCYASLITLKDLD